MRILIAAGKALLNFWIFGFGFLIVTRLVYWGRARPALMCAAFLVASGLVGLWSEWWAVVGPAGLGFLWGVGALKWAIHLTDTRGEYAPPMLQYVLNSEPSDVLWSLVAAAAAGIGSWMSAFLRTAATRKSAAGDPYDSAFSFCGGTA